MNFKKFVNWLAASSNLEIRIFTFLTSLALAIFTGLYNPAGAGFLILLITVLTCEAPELRGYLLQSNPTSAFLGLSLLVATFWLAPYSEGIMALMVFGTALTFITKAGSKQSIAAFATATKAPFVRVRRDPSLPRTNTQRKRDAWLARQGKK